jgi:hypothetical protein
MATVMAQGLKPQVLKRLYAALKGRSSTTGVLPQRLKPVFIEAEAAGMNACSTLRGIAMAIRRGMNACSTLRGIAMAIRRGINGGSMARTPQTWKLVAFAPMGVR